MYSKTMAYRLYEKNSTPNVVSEIKSNRVGWLVYLQNIEEVRNAKRILIEADHGAITDKMVGSNLKGKLKTVAVESSSKESKEAPELRENQISLLWI